jgi:phosphoglucosamine mutase
LARLFGTDGVRGVAGRDLTARLAMDLSVAAAGAMDSMGPSARHMPKAAARSR